MITRELEDEVRMRVVVARLLRCGTTPFIQPPRHWPEMIQSSWPSQWFLPPWGVPDGLIDLVMAMCEHIGNLDPAARFHSAFIDSLDGSLTVRCGFEVEAVYDVVGAYSLMSRTLCGVCGFEGRMRDIVSDDVRTARVVRCDDHFQGR